MAAKAKQAKGSSGTAGTEFLKFSAPLRRSRARWTLSDEELACRAQQGCREAFAELVDRFGGRLQQFLRKKVGNVHDAEDLAQDTFVKAYRFLESYKGSGRFSTWLFTIAHHLVCSHYRRIPNTQSGEDFQASNPEPIEVLAEQERKKSLWDAARDLSENQFEALWLKYSEDMTIKEIARVMGKSQVHVKVLLYRGRKNLADRLGGEYGREKQESEKPKIRCYPVHESAGA
jgi:RNA polymerase sigma-70 factor (ECF subfamily)